MGQRPELSKGLDARTFRSYYYLKQELVDFCRDNGLPMSGGKEALTDRIARYLETGEVLPASGRGRAKPSVGELTLDTLIEPNFVCSEKHRAFFKAVIGAGFSFNVEFQTWLKANAGKTYTQAVEAYGQIREEKKKRKTAIGAQFEYNAYIRDFFADNSGRPLEDAIRCWSYKKALQGHNRYEKSDLIALNNAHPIKEEI